MKYVRQQTSEELASHMRHLQAMSGWHDPLADRLFEEVEKLKAENEALRLERKGKVLCDLELFETLRDSAYTEAAEHHQCMATYRPLRQEALDSVVMKCDELLAMSKEP